MVLPFGSEVVDGDCGFAARLGHDLHGWVPEGCGWVSPFGWDGWVSLFGWDGWVSSFGWDGWVRVVSPFGWDGWVRVVSPFGWRTAPRGRPFEALDH